MSKWRHVLLYFFLVIVLFVLLWFTDSDYPFCYLQLFFLIYTYSYITGSCKNTGNHWGFMATIIAATCIVTLLVSQPSVFSFDLYYFLNEDNHIGGGVKIAIFGQSMFYLVCFNCDLILIEHRNKHIVTFFLIIALNWYTL